VPATLTRCWSRSIDFQFCLSFPGSADPAQPVSDSWGANDEMSTDEISGAHARVSGARGAAEVEGLISADRDLQRVAGCPRDSASLRKTGACAARQRGPTLLASVPDSAFVVACDAARQAGAAVLAQERCDPPVAVAARP
jgi:hypothetical protein